MLHRSRKTKSLRNQGGAAVWDRDGHRERTQPRQEQGQGWLGQGQREEWGGCCGAPGWPGNGQVRAGECGQCVHAGHCTVTRLRDTLLGAALLWVRAWHPSCSQRRLSPCQSHVPALYLGSKLLRAHWQGSGQHRTLWGPGPHQASQVSECSHSRAQAWQLKVIPPTPAAIHIHAILISWG